MIDHIPVFPGFLRQKISAVFGVAKVGSRAYRDAVAGAEKSFPVHDFVDLFCQMYENSSHLHACRGFSHVVIDI